MGRGREKESKGSDGREREKESKGGDRHRERKKKLSLPLYTSVSGVE